jgi:hypothetical protein
MCQLSGNRWNIVHKVGSLFITWNEHRCFTVSYDVNLNSDAVFL